MKLTFVGVIGSVLSGLVTRRVLGLACVARGGLIGFNLDLLILGIDGGGRFVVLLAHVA